MKRLGIQRSITVLAMLIVIPLTGCFDECRTDADCDDGLWCNSVERCGYQDEGFSSSWGFSQPPSGARICKPTYTYPCCSILEQNCNIPLPLLTELIAGVCNEAEQECIPFGECVTNDDCFDGSVCNGNDYCVLGKCLVSPVDCSGATCLEPEPGRPDNVSCHSVEGGDDILFSPTYGPPRFRD